MKLVEQGRIGLDEPVAKYLPEYHGKQSPVLRIRHLLTQTSGLPEWDELPGMEEIDTGAPARFTLGKVIELIGRQPPLYPPANGGPTATRTIPCLPA